MCHTGDRRQQHTLFILKIKANKQDCPEVVRLKFQDSDSSKVKDPIKPKGQKKADVPQALNYDASDLTIKLGASELNQLTNSQYPFFTIERVLDPWHERFPTKREFYFVCLFCFLQKLGVVGVWKNVSYLTAFEGKSRRWKPSSLHPQTPEVSLQDRLGLVRLPMSSNNGVCGQLGMTEVLLDTKDSGTMTPTIFVCPGFIFPLDYYGPNLSIFRFLCFRKSDLWDWSPPATNSRSSFCPPDKVQYLWFQKT